MVGTITDLQQKYSRSCVVTPILRRRGADTQRAEIEYFAALLFGMRPEVSVSGACVEKAGAWGWAQDFGYGGGDSNKRPGDCPIPEIGVALQFRNTGPGRKPSEYAKTRLMRHWLGPFTCAPTIWATCRYAAAGVSAANGLKIISLNMRNILSLS